MHRPAARLAILTTLLLAMCLSCASAAVATSPPATPAPHGGTIVEVGHDATVDPDDVVNDAVAVGGDVIVAGTLRGSAVAVGGDVVLLPTALVLGNAVSIGGHVDRQPGSTVHGNVVSTRFGFVGSAASALLGEPVWHPFRAGTLLGWVASTILYVLVAVLCALLVPRQVMAVRDRVVRHPWTSVGWGALTAGVLVPISSVLLLVSVIGVLVLIPWLLIVVPLAFFFGFACVGALVGRRLLGMLGVRRERLVASAVGVLLLHLLRLIPYAGSVCGCWPGSPASAPWRLYVVAGPAGRAAARRPAAAGPSASRVRLSRQKIRTSSFSDDCSVTRTWMPKQPARSRAAPGNRRPGASDPVPS